MTQDAHLMIVRNTESSKNSKQLVIGCECIDINVNDQQFTVYSTAGVRRELPHQFVAAHNTKPPWSTKAFVRTVREIEHHNVACSVIFGNAFPYKHPREWTTQPVIPLGEASKEYVV
jgi:hypothetical protein